MDVPQDPGDDGDDDGEEEGLLPSPWRPEESGDADGEEGQGPSAESGRTEAPALRIELPSGHHALRGLVRGLSGFVVLAAAGALIAIDRHSRGAAEVFSLLAIASAALTAPVIAVAKRLARYPAKGLFELSKRGFRLPWLTREAPGPEGPWEALRGFAVRPIRGGRILVLELSAGRFALTDRSLGEKAFDAAVEALEKAVGPEGVLLGTLVRLPIHPTDRRGFVERKRPWLVALAVVALFVLLASQATLLAVRVASALGAFFATLAASAAQSLNRVPTAELVLGLEDLIVPLPDDLRRTVKIPLGSLRGNSFEDEADGVVLVIEHEKGQLRYPVEWFDVREMREFARQVADRAG